MPKVTKIEIQKTQKGFNIYLDGKYSFSLNPLVYLQSKLKINQELSEKEIDGLIFQSNFQQLYDSTLNLISFRPRSEKEIRDYLNKKTSTTESDKFSELIINRLKENNHLDDEKFIEWWIDQRQTFRPRSKFALTIELQRKGIDTDLINRKMAQLFDSKIEFDQVRLLAEKKLKRLSGQPTRIVRQKIGRYLASRGFDWDKIKAVLEEILEKR